MGAVFRSRRMLRAACLGGSCALALAALAAAPAWARPHVEQVRPAVPLGSASPFKLERSTAHGIVPRRGGRRAASASPFASPLSQSCLSACAPQLLYHNGSVMRKVKLYLILWEPSEPEANGQEGTSFEKVPPGYVAGVEAFLRNVATESGTLANVFSVDSLYGESEALGGGEYSAQFGGVLLDTESYPARNATTCPVATKAEEEAGFGLPPKGQPCISDTKEALQLPQAILDVISRYDASHPGTPLAEGTEAIYFLLTPHQVNSCSGFEGGVASCNTNAYCAYHSAFSYESGKHRVVYANMPYDDVPGCRTPAQPNGSPADDEVNTLSHEGNEAITDPLGTGWYDYNGNEIADKCTYPFFDSSEDANPSTDAYGPLLNGSSGTTGYNQEIDTGRYLLQREWSNAAGGCVARAPAPEASFTAYSSPATAGQPVSFDGSSSTATAGRLDHYMWEFGDGTVEQGEADAVTSHVYPTPGIYTVTLSVENSSGAQASTSRQVAVEAPPVPPPPIVTTTTATKTVNVPVVAKVTRYSPASVARGLALPPNGRRLPGPGKIVLGHASCPPACGVAVRLTLPSTTRNGSRRNLSVVIGHVKESVSGHGTIAIALRLSKRGRRLLRKHRHGLRVVASIEVRDREGGSWTFKRSLRLTVSGGASASRRRSGHRRRRPSGRHRRHRA